MTAKNTVKTFILPSDGMELRQCSDRFAVSLKRGRYCVADGVTNSFCGGILAGCMCLDFISEKDPASSWRDGLETEPGRKEILSDLFEEACDGLEKTLPASELKWLQRMKRLHCHGATTLAGISFVNGQLHYSVTGDSTFREFFVCDIYTISRAKSQYRFKIKPSYEHPRGKICVNRLLPWRLISQRS